MKVSQLIVGRGRDGHGRMPDRPRSCRRSFDRAASHPQPAAGRRGSRPHPDARTPSAAARGPAREPEPEPHPNPAGRPVGTDPQQHQPGGPGGVKVYCGVQRPAGARLEQRPAQVGCRIHFLHAQGRRQPADPGPGSAQLDLNGPVSVRSPNDFTPPYGQAAGNLTAYVMIDGVVRHAQRPAVQLARAPPSPDRRGPARARSLDRQRTRPTSSCSTSRPRCPRSRQGVPPRLRPAHRARRPALARRFPPRTATTGTTETRTCAASWTGGRRRARTPWPPRPAV